MLLLHASLISVQFFAHYGVCGCHAGTNSLREDAVTSRFPHFCAVFLHIMEFVDAMQAHSVSERIANSFTFP
jgi:hypothetical protein